MNLKIINNNIYRENKTFAYDRLVVESDAPPFELEGENWKIKEVGFISGDFSIPLSDLRLLGITRKRFIEGLINTLDENIKERPYDKLKSNFNSKIVVDGYPFMLNVTLFFQNSELCDNKVEGKSPVIIVIRNIDIWLSSHRGIVDNLLHYYLPSPYGVLFLGVIASLIGTPKIAQGSFCYGLSLVFIGTICSVIAAVVFELIRMSTSDDARSPEEAVWKLYRRVCREINSSSNEKDKKFLVTFRNYIESNYNLPKGILYLLKILYSMR